MSTIVNEENMKGPEEVKKEMESNVTLFFGKDGEPLRVSRYRGHNIIYLEIALSALSKIHTLKIRPDDILLYSHPGAGSHWMFEVANMILRGTSERVPMIKEELMLDYAPIENLDSAESPRLLNTHLSIDFLPPELLKDHKIIYLNRNPKAMLVTFYRHLLAGKSYEYNGDFSSFFDLFMKGEVPFDDYFKHTQEFYALIKDNPNAIIITYEEMKGDIFKVVSRVAKFLGKIISDQLTKDIVEMCSFNKMKSEKSLTCSYISKDIFKDGGTLYHTGKVETWKKWMTVEQSERMDARIQSEFTERGIKFNF